MIIKIYTKNDFTSPKENSDIKFNFIERSQMIKAPIKSAINPNIKAKRMYRNSFLRVINIFLDLIV